MDISAHTGHRGYKRCRQAAFSLIEVTLAIGIVAFAFMSILGLLPIGMNTFRQAMNTSICSQIGEQVMNDVQETDFNDLMSPASGNSSNNSGSPFLLSSGSSATQTTRYFDYRGNELTAGSSTAAPQGALYWVHTRITPNTILPGSASTNAANSGNPALATVTIQIINNPGETILSKIQTDSTTSSPTYLLWNDPRFQTYTYSGLVSQNNDL
jgi:uncharacterized protein (TIGR02598 family)